MRVLVVLLCLARLAAAEHPAQPQAETEEAIDHAIEGYLYFETRLRTAGGETDVDFYAHAYSDVTFGAETPLRMRFNGRMIADIGGSQVPGDLLYDTWDTFDHDAQFRLYEVFGEFEAKSLKTTFRLGRQFLDEGVYLHFDGGRATVKVGRAEISLLLGIPVRLGEPSRDGNWLGGIVITAPLTDATRIRFEYYHVEESFPGINDPVVDPSDPGQQPIVIPAQTFEDDLVGVSLWHRIADNLRAYGRFSILNKEANELHLRLRWFTADGKWSAVIEWYQLFERLFAVTNDLTPFVPMLGSYAPFARLSIRVTRRFGDDWTAVAGYSHRELVDTPESSFNHDYDQFFVTATRAGLAEGRLDLTITLNGYDSGGNDVFAAGGHIDFRLSEKIELSGGIDYSLYKYVWFQNTEREDVWTYSLRVRWKAKKSIKVTGGVTVDNDRFETYVTMFVRVTVRF